MAEHRVPREQGDGGSRWETLTVAALCGLAALRVLFFSAVFPFFNNVDEKAQLDLVHKYARGHRPSRPVEGYDAAAALLIARYASPEYLGSRESWGGAEHPVPVWKWPTERAERHVERQARRWQRQSNYELHSPPTYYWLAGLWYRAGKHLGLEGGSLLYWLRFLNAPLVVLLLLCAHRFCRRHFDGVFLPVAVVALLAFLPQDAFYAIGADVLSPLAFLVSLMLLLRWQRARPPSLLLSLALGGAVAATFLTKFTNLALPLVFGGLLGVRVGGLARAAAKTREGAAIATAALAAAGPVLFWMARNQILLGDPTGTEAKVAHLGWTPRPIADYLAHPLFSLDGAWSLVNGLFVTFWRGEFMWLEDGMGLVWADRFYAISSFALLAAAAIAGASRWRKGVRAPVSEAGSAGRDDPLALTLLWISVVGSMLIMAALSVVFAFGRSIYPSEDYPFFVSSRLVLGALVPFLILYVRGMEVAVEPLAGRWGARLLVALAVLVTLVSELSLTRPVFSSPFNWFHLP